MDFENLQRQLDELEALRAMYPAEEGCFILAAAEQQALHAAQAIMQAVAVDGAGQEDIQLLNLSGTVKLPHVLLAGCPIALRFQLPVGYPSTAAPQIAVECSAPRLVHERLSAAMAAAAQEFVGSESLLLLLDRLQDELALAEAAPQQEHSAGHGDESAAAGHEGRAQTAAAAGGGDAAGGIAAVTSAASCPHELLRVVIWFHHIKSTQKRKNLVAWARELGIGGYSKPGFPGVVVAEGLTADVREYVAKIRALQWQAMQVCGEERAACPVCSSSCSSGPGTDNGSAYRCEDSGDVAARKQAIHSLMPRRCFNGQFTELPESGMSQLGQMCKDAGLENLFLAALKINAK